jgi:hypothetical protein
VTTPAGEGAFSDLRADYGWFHVMRSRIMAGLVAEIGFPAVATYLVIKAHANHQDGVAFPSQERLAKLMGCSVDTVSRATKTLVQAGLIRERGRGRHKEYLMLENAPVTERASGTVQGNAQFEYVPAIFATQVESIRQALIRGLPPGDGVTLNLTVNLIQQGDHGTVNIAVNSGRPERSDASELTRRLRDL